jgi:hypothetical protein
MQKLVLEIPENKYQFFMELLSNFDFVKITKSNPPKLSGKQKVFVDDLKKSLNEVELHRKGKIKLQTAKEFLNEL